MYGDKDIKIRKHQTVMHRRPGVVAVSEWILFKQESPPTRTVQIAVHPDKWAEMGKPDTLTVMVEGGDLLNADN